MAGLGLLASRGGNGGGLRKGLPRCREVSRQKGRIRHPIHFGSQGLFSTAKITAHAAHRRRATVLRY